MDTSFGEVFFGGLGYFSSSGEHSKLFFLFFSFVKLQDTNEFAKIFKMDEPTLKSLNNLNGWKIGSTLRTGQKLCAAQSLRPSTDYIVDTKTLRGVWLCRPGADRGDGDVFVDFDAPCWAELVLEQTDLPVKSCLWCRKLPRRFFDSENWKHAFCSLECYFGLRQEEHSRLLQMYPESKIPALEPIKQFPKSYADLTLFTTQELQQYVNSQFDPCKLDAKQFVVNQK